MATVGHQPRAPLRGVPSLLGAMRSGAPRLGSAAPSHRQSLARFGEVMAERFLEERGATVLGRNVRLGRGEIDLHVSLDGVSVAVEVKTVVARRRSDDAIYQFSFRKADTVRRYARRLQPPAKRVDFVAITFRAHGADIRWVPFAA